MNAGGHGSDMAACVADADVVDLDGEAPGVVRWAVERARSALPWVGPRRPPRRRLGARCGSTAATARPSEATIAEIVRWRREHQPGGQNCGSVFVNPVPGEVSAGLLVDGLGLRGLRIGSAWVSEKHANFIQAADGGSAADVRAVIEAVRARVAAETGVVLRSEVRLVGFEDARDADGASRGPDVPSAEVLDELLRAFSADTDDAERLEQVDLESPAVQELLAPEPEPDVHGDRRASI